MTQYATDQNLAARQRLWSRTEPSFDLMSWVLELAGEGRTLDVGCGNGAYLDRRPDAVGMDLSHGMLRSMPVAAALVCGDAQALPFATDAFDVVLAPHMLYHVPDREAAAHELRRVCRDGGVCVAVTNGERSHREMRDMLEEVVGRGWRWRRPSNVAFSLDNGAAQLAVAFASVARVDTPPRQMIVDDADAYAAYIASVVDIDGRSGADDHPWIAWSDVVAECRRRCAEIIERDGAFRISVEVGAFVCR